MRKFYNKVALVAGNLGKIKKDKFIMGLGGIIASQLFKQGAEVIVIDVDKNISMECAKTLHSNVKPMHCDLFRERTYDTRPYIDERGREKYEVLWKDFPALDLIKDIIKKYGKLDILITNFDTYKQARIENSTEEMYNQLRDENIWPVFHLLSAVREQFKEQHELTGQFARVVMVTSIFGKAGLSLGTLYSAFKGSLVGLTKCLAREFSRFANVNAIAYGPLVEKKMQGPRDRVVASYISTQTEMAESPLSIEDVTPLVTFLASNEARAITGQIMNVDQGLWLKLEA